MKKTIVFGLLFAACGHLTAQNVTFKSDEFQINTTNGADTTNSFIPVIEWLTPAKELFQTIESNVSIRAQVSSESKLTRIVFSIKDAKGEKPRAERNFPIEEGSGFEVFVDQTIRLKEGNNYIELIAYNQDGMITTSYRSIISGKDAISSAFATDRTDYALIFGTDKYDEWTDLVNPIDDAKTIEGELQKLYGFETELVYNATQDEVIEKIREYTREKTFKSQDQLFIFFAGHGHYDETFNEGYVVAKNSLQNDPSFNSYISYNRLRSLINNIDCDHILVMLDVCFGGTFDQSLSRGHEDAYMDKDRNEYISTKLGFRTRKFVTSGGMTYVSDGIPGKHSPFTNRILEALRNYGGADRVLTYNEMIGFVEKANPSPHFGDFGDNEPGSDFMFIIR